MSASRLRALYPVRQPSDLIDVLVIGGGVVGLAIGRRLARLANRSTFVIERNHAIGQETSSRNSEVIHAGIYYPPDSLKTSLCIRGRKLLYKYCHEKNIPTRKTGKLIFAGDKSQDPGQRDALVKLHNHAKALSIPTQLHLDNSDYIKDLEPDLSDDCAHSVLVSSETGIVDSHALMQTIENDLFESGGHVVLGSRVVRIDRDVDEGNWIVQTVSGTDSKNDVYTIRAKLVVNASGLCAHQVLNQVLPEAEYKRQFYALGHYFSYRGPGVSKVSHLLYPCPPSSTAAVKSLGTHLTLDMAGGIRFGPDIQWVEPVRDSITGEETQDEFWKPWYKNHLSSSSNEHDRKELTFHTVKKYLPQVELDNFQPDYVGIRPKLAPQSSTAFSDFSISHILPGFVNLMGIESPGLTSSMAIAEVVENIAKTQVFGLGRGTGRTISEIGKTFDEWG